MIETRLWSKVVTCLITEPHRTNCSNMCLGSWKRGTVRIKGKKKINKSLFLHLALILENMCSKEGSFFVSSYLPFFWQQASSWGAICPIPPYSPLPQLKHPCSQCSHVTLRSERKGILRNKCLLTWNSFSPIIFIYICLFFFFKVCLKPKWMFFTKSQWCNWKASEQCLEWPCD